MSVMHPAVPQLQGGIVVACFHCFLSSVDMIDQSHGQKPFKVFTAHSYRGGVHPHRSKAQLCKQTAKQLWSPAESSVQRSVIYWITLLLDWSLLSMLPLQLFFPPPARTRYTLSHVFTAHTAFRTGWVHIARTACSLVHNAHTHTVSGQVWTHYSTHLAHTCTHTITTHTQHYPTNCARYTPTVWCSQDSGDDSPFVAVSWQRIIILVSLLGYVAFRFWSHLVALT